MARSGLIDLKSPLMLKGDYKPSFPLRLMLKIWDWRWTSAKQLGVALPTTTAAREAYSDVKAKQKKISTTPG